MPLFSRKPTSIPGFDYSKSYYYFVTVCTNEKACIEVNVDHFVIMPNHIHAIIAIENWQSRSDLSNIVGAYKAGVSRKSRRLYPNITIWQRSFHDHIIRNQNDHENNPAKWQEDCFYTK